MNSKQIANETRWHNPYSDIQKDLRKFLKDLLCQHFTITERPYPHLVTSRKVNPESIAPFTRVYRLSLLVRPPYVKRAKQEKHNITAGQDEILLFIHTDIDPQSGSGTIFNFRLKDGQRSWLNENLAIPYFQLIEKQEEARDYFLAADHRSLVKMILETFEREIQKHSGNMVPR